MNKTMETYIYPRFAQNNENKFQNVFRKTTYKPLRNHTMLAFQFLINLINYFLLINLYNIALVYFSNFADLPMIKKCTLTIICFQRLFLHKKLKCAKFIVDYKGLYLINYILNILAKFKQLLQPYIHLKVAKKQIM
jgi:hypothetical protein